MSKRLQILVPDELDARLRKTAARRGMSVGAWVRRAIEDAFGRERTTDALEELAALNAPSGDIDQMLREIEAGRG
jgi:predicted transcriptional regulator